ncbi:MAG: SagB family peptide dehydrogenase [Gordonia sp. (in: high G+C Gram-positive bacteria)]|uniref:SagB family peptide dehydrogenase n=1 Tax=Gordonia sp. (in: high G+C Gram-positive bacteria) TaxID=84139 RepID=UPI0039E2EEAA
MATSTTYTLAPDVKCLLAGPDTAVILPAKTRLEALAPAPMAALKALNSGPIRFTADPPPEVADVLARLLGAAAVTLGVDDGYELHPFRAAPGPRPPAGESSGARLSKFAVLRRGDGKAVLESPRAWCDVEIGDPALVAALLGLGDDSPGLDRFWADLVWTGHAVADDEAESFSTAAWSPHELWFHRRSTVGDRTTSWTHIGPTRWADGTFEPLPARPEPYPGTPIELPTPDLDALRTSDATLTAALEDRRSVREFDDARPPSLAAIAELLYRAARTRSVRTTNGDRPVPEELPSKPYASGGSLYELEIYPIVRVADGIAPGMYHYDSTAHTLEPVADLDDPAVARLLAPAALTLADGKQPPVLFVIAARVGRMMWTYEQMSYAVILKHVGILTHSLYLIATAMGLGGVAQGYGDTAAFAAATGRDELDECLVGSFVVGTPV